MKPTFHFLLLSFIFLFFCGTSFALSARTDTVPPPCIMIIADQMDVFYIGVDNPISLSIPGLASSEYQLKASGCGARVVSDGIGHYILNVTTPGEVLITIVTGDWTTSYRYRVKRIPNPTPLLGARHGSKSLKADEFKAQLGIATVLENFDFEAKCDVVGFEMVRIRQNGAKSTLTNPGGKYTEEATAFIQKAVPGDTFLFNNIKARCPGDSAARNLGSLVFMIE